MFKVIRSGFLVVVYYESRKRVFFYTLFVYYIWINKARAKDKRYIYFSCWTHPGSQGTFFFLAQGLYA
jgi:hypothetical protein